MDDELDDRFLGSRYCEQWLPAEATDEVVRRLRGHFAAGGFAATGGYTVELYGAPASRFLLSPGHGRDSIRVNACWHDRAGPPARREAFFAALDALLADLDPRHHWAKRLPPGPAAHPGVPAFRAAREQLDPDGVFLTARWREALGIATPRPAPAPARVAQRTVGPPGRRWPLLFTLRPSDPSFAERAEHVLDVHAVLRSPAEAIFDAVVDLVDAPEWLRDFVHAEWLDETTVLETFRFMTQRVRTLHAERGRRWIASMDAVTLPLGRELLEDLQLETLPDGRTLVRWRFFYDLEPFMRPVHVLLRREFTAMLTTSLARLDERLTPATQSAPPRAAAVPAAR